MVIVFYMNTNGYAFDVGIFDVGTFDVGTFDVGTLDDSETYVKTSPPQPAIAVNILGARSLAGFIA